jgi:alkanesulfonate monooxygenase SsuD/methylene tetrahydromethanopterin reductase-like flavin-dependent oxidoreductase (luciferase family)
MMNENGNSRLRFGLFYDFRNPAAWQRPYADIYSEIFEQIVWAEGHGFDNVWLSEHHLVEDGYAPGTLPIAAAIAARTKTIRIGTAIMILPLHNPIRVAEDAATVDVISGGRFELGVAPGYKVEEYESFGIPKQERGGRTNEGLEIIRRLLEGETLTYKGKYYEVVRAKIAPPPVQQPRLPLWAGGFTPASTQRAARYADGFLAVGGPSKELFDSYVAALQDLGKPTRDLRVGGGYFWLIPALDPEKSWAEAAPHVLYQLNLYAEWFARSGMPLLPHIRDAEHLRELGILNIVDVDTCIAMIQGMVNGVPLTHYYSFTLPPGLPASWIQPHLELFAGKVIPAFREQAVPVG